MRLLGRTAVAALAGVGTGLSFAPQHWVLLLPLCVAALTLACDGRRLRSGFWLGAVFGSAFMLVLVPWVRVIGVYAWVPLAVAEGLFYGLVGLVAAAVTRRLGSRARLPGWPLWAAGGWVLVEGLRATFPFGGFPWGGLAFATEDTPVAATLAYGGAAGTTFVVALLGTVLAWAVLRVRAAPVRVVAGLVGAVVLAGVASVVPWWTGPATADRSVRVAAVQGNVPGTGLDAFAEQRVVLDHHVQATLDLAHRVASGRAPRPDLVVWPENSSDIDPYADPSAAAAIGGAAAAMHAPLLMGAVLDDRTYGHRNRAIVWSAHGAPGAYYDKTHLVPFGEYIPLRSLFAPHFGALRQIPHDMVPGHRPGVLRVGPARAGVLMCFEVAYDSLVRAVVEHGADVVVVPTNNATYTGTGQIEQQFAMSRLRAVETGRYVVVASTNGISGIVAPDGQVEARAPQQRQAVLERTIRLVARLTPAVRLGPWPQLVLSGFAVVPALAAVLLGYRRRARRAEEGPR